MRVILGGLKGLLIDDPLWSCTAIDYRGRFSTIDDVLIHWTVNYFWLTETYSYRIGSSLHPSNIDSALLRPRVNILLDV